MVVISGNGFTPTDEVFFGARSSNSVVFVDRSTLRATVPAGSAGVVDVTVSRGGVNSTLRRAFEYLPAPTITYFDASFEDGGLGGLSKGGTGSVTVSSDVAYAGTKSAKSAVSSGTIGANAALRFSFGATATPNPALSSPTGVYTRWYLYIPSSTFPTITGRDIGGTEFGQIKLHLFRKTTGSGQPGWIMAGVGSGFGGPALRAFIDQFILTIPGGNTTTTFGDGVWHELQIWNQRANGTGRAKMWIDGRQIFDVNAGNLGSDSPLDEYVVSIGIAYIQSNAAAFLYVDNAKGANGYIDP